MQAPRLPSGLAHILDAVVFAVNRPKPENLTLIDAQ
tara:strand:+ start:5405 stop:5512 length:108 start_codon:yes stop_codon:yes gene_type:complete